jgi:hypothetical protein
LIEAFGSPKVMRIKNKAMQHKGDRVGSYTEVGLKERNVHLKQEKEVDFV